MWFAGRTEPVRRALWRGFGDTAETAAFPVPSMRVVQDHGTVEIMRGCPNACRFCHAAAFYRPCRRKDAAAIRREADELVRLAGYREITLSSLSSGDYPGIHGLVRGLNAEWAAEKVSFSLPSLRVDSLSLGLLAELAEVRKSGLTFAVETPRPEWQLDVRKQVPLEKVVAILREAKARGWKAAKFYFMVGLPPAAGADEAGPIVDFLREVRAATGFSLNVNVASFIPKPHTPYERAAQIGERTRSRRSVASGTASTATGSRSATTRRSCRCSKASCRGATRGRESSCSKRTGAARASTPGRSTSRKPRGDRSSPKRRGMSRSKPAGSARRRNACRGPTSAWPYRGARCTSRLGNR